MSTINDFCLHMEKQKKILDQTFPHDSCGYLGIVEVPHVFVYDTVTSNEDFKHFQDEMKNYPYHYAWEVSDLKKVSTFVDSILEYIDKYEAYDQENYMFDLMISEIQPYLVQEIDPYFDDSRTTSR